MVQNPKPPIPQPKRRVIDQDYGRVLDVNQGHIGHYRHTVLEVAHRMNMRSNAGHLISTTNPQPAMALSSLSARQLAQFKASLGHVHVKFVEQIIRPDPVVTRREGLREIPPMMRLSPSSCSTTTKPPSDDAVAVVCMHYATWGRHRHRQWRRRLTTSLTRIIIIMKVLVNTTVFVKSC